MELLLIMFPATKATTYFDSQLSLNEVTVNEFHTVCIEYSVNQSEMTLKSFLDS